MRTRHWMGVAAAVGMAGGLLPGSADASAHVTNPANGHVYEYVENANQNADQAAADAATRWHMGVQGHLVTITSAEEQAFVEGLLDPRGVGTYLGLTDKATEGTFEWVTGEPLVYTNWNGSEPNNFGGNEDCALFFGPSNVNNAPFGRWNDIPCGSVFPSSDEGYLVEYDIPLDTNPCSRSNATIYVDDAGIIQGGPLDGQRYGGTLRGTPEADVIVGTPKADIIYAYAGDDLICGWGGDDTIWAGFNHDTVHAGRGNDVVYGEDGNDRLNGNEDDDILRGGPGRDRLRGGPGGDVFNGGGGVDRNIDVSAAEGDTVV